MNGELSNNAKAILMLCAPLIIGKKKESLETLTTKEYQILARHLHKQGSAPGDLLDPLKLEPLLMDYPEAEKGRITRLLGRGFLLSQAVEKWAGRAIWVVSRADKEYPLRLKETLRDSAPPILYGCGLRNDLESGGVAIVGSRQIDEELTEYTKDVAKLVARSKKTVISGGARGIDQTAMDSALNEGGKVIGVLSDSLERAVMNRAHRDHIMNDKLVLVSPYDPGAGFNVGNAMSRNKLIYCLSDIALVINSDYNKGGTWAGASEELKRKRIIVYVRSTGKQSKGLDELKRLGAIEWPNPRSEDELIQLHSYDYEMMNNQQGLFDQNTRKRSSIQINEEQENYTSVERISNDDKIEPANISTSIIEGLEVTRMLQSMEKQTPSQELYLKAKDLIISNLSTGRSVMEIAELLSVNKSQAQTWLDKLISDNALIKKGRPVRYLRKDKGLF